jgi:ribosome-binding factor A
VAADLRKHRLESLLAELISEILARGRVRDPRLQSMMTVTEVRAASDMRDAKVFISVVDRATGREGERPQARDRRAGAIDALNHAAGYIQHLLGEHLTLRVTPRLHFVLDTQIERSFNLARKLEELARPQGGQADPQGEPARPSDAEAGPSEGLAH